MLDLISRLNREHGTTFLLSSHQLPYLEQICSHIAILHKGRIELSDTVSNLLGNTKTTLQIKTSEIEAATRVLENIPGVNLLNIDASGYLNISVTDSDSASVNRALVENQVPVAELLLKRASLAALFREISSEDGR